MPTNKPQVKAYIDNVTYEKIKVIAEKERRSISNLIEILIVKEIENYETNNGNINTVNIGRDNHGNISF